MVSQSSSNMKLLHTFIAAAFLATGSCLEIGDLVSGQVYNASDIAELLKENPLDPGNGEGYEFPEGEGPTFPEDAGSDMEILENKYCYVQAFSGNHCDGKAGAKVRMEKTKGNHVCINTQDRHSFWYSNGCGRGNMWAYDNTRCSVIGIVWVAFWEIPENNKAACKNVDLGGHNWQRMQWQKW